MSLRARERRDAAMAAAASGGDNTVVFLGMKMAPWQKVGLIVLLVLSVVGIAWLLIDAYTASADETLDEEEDGATDSPAVTPEPKKNISKDVRGMSRRDRRNRAQKIARNRAPGKRRMIRRRMMWRRRRAG